MVSRSSIILLLAIMNNEPLAYFITFTIYGTFLQGDARWWRSRDEGLRSPQPNLEKWHRHRLNHDILLLNELQRLAVESEVKRFCEYRGWHLWKCNPRSNHVHLVASARSVTGEKVRDQVKANCTRVLREKWKCFEGRPVWSVGGDWQCINTEDDLEQVIAYVADAQDLKKLDPKISAGRP